MANSKSQFGAKQTSINMISQVVSFIINLAISFFLTPFIVTRLGEAAYGFVGLSSNFISYATLITTAINSMAGRFIAVAYYKGDKEDVVKYYSSVIVANVVLCFLLSIPALFIILFLPSIINVPANLVQDVTALFILVFSHFFVDLVGNTFSNAGYVVNRLDMVAMRKTEASVLKGILSLAVFALLIPRLWYIGLVQLLCSGYNFLRNYQIQRRLMPEIRLNVRRFEFSKIKELLASGIWNTISSAGSILISGLDLLIVNVAVSAAAMGVVSIAKQIPIYIQSFASLISGVFSPAQTKAFAENDKQKIRANFFYSAKIMIFISAISVAFLIVYGKSFFSLWISSVDATSLWIIAVVVIAFLPIQVITYPFASIIIALNKVRFNSLLTLGAAILGLGVTALLLQFSPNENISVLIILTTNVTVSILKSWFIGIPYVLRLIDCKMVDCYLMFVKSVIASIIVTGLSYLLSLVFAVSGWVTLIVSGLCVCVIGALCMDIFVLNKEDKRRIVFAIKKIVGKRKAK